jgi:hypothetical protein
MDNRRLNEKIPERPASEGELTLASIILTAKRFTPGNANGLVRPNVCSHSRLDWIISSCIVKVTAERLKIHVLNIKKSALNLSRKDL